MSRVLALSVLVCLGTVALRGETASERARASDPSFRFTEPNTNSLALWQGTDPVLVYNHGRLQKPGVPADRARSTYIHPLYGLDGEVLTDDFPGDHLHHRGLFWAWPHVSIGGKQYDLWMLQGIEQRFQRWLARDVGPTRAVLGVENGWFVGTRQVVKERLWLTVAAASRTERVLDLDFTWVPLTNAITLAGAEGKSYGGLTLRFAPRTMTRITTPQGNQSNDLYMARLPWADLSAQFAGGQGTSGAAIFIAPDHPDYPPTWLTRHYGVLCVGWPGVQPETFAPGQAIHCRYRVWIHRGSADRARLETAYRAYGDALNAHAAGIEPARRPTPSRNQAQVLKAEARSDRVDVYVGGTLFTEYLSLPNAKYPYFYPVNGPRTGRSITIRGADPYPHHSSLFFGCDRVNGGDYWQEGLERGRIVSQGIRVVQARGKTVVLEQRCRWERSGAPSPFADQRRITISAPTADRRLIDFDITLTAQTDVRIEKSNHSLFAARVAPEISVDGGGSLVNATGAQGESGTFGHAAPWADYRGEREGRVVEGLTIMSDPANRWSPPPWFTRDYGFFSPTPMNWLSEDALHLPRGESMHLRYRVLVHADEPSPAELGALYRAWASR